MGEAILFWAIVVILLVLLVVAILVRKKYPRPTDYYSFFWMGIMWMILGIPMAFFSDSNYFFFIMGVVFTVLGLANRNKWKKNRVRWKDLKKPEKLIQRILIGVLAFLIAVGIAFLLVKAKILM